LDVAGIPFSPDLADAWRARIGWMPQTPHFMDASIADNVEMGRRGDLDAALAAAGIADVIKALPDGVHTRLGENGGGLSGGEARRLTLARAIFGKPDIILADEPTADLDAETAAVVAACLLGEARRGAMLVVATHDAVFASKLGQIVRFGGAS
jgi:ATP-binding cassette subfamily C protein CydD